MVGPLRTIAIVGTSGSGKTYFGQRIAKNMSLPFTDLDDLFFLPNWVIREEQDFIEDVKQVVKTDRWVIAGNYSIARSHIWSEADLVVWVDYSFARTLWQLLLRSIDRVWRQRDICGGNYESFRKTFLSRDSILLWAINTYGKRRREYPHLLDQRILQAQGVLRLGSPAEMHRFLACFNRP